jgi:hypothetical protein
MTLDWDEWTDLGFQVPMFRPSSKWYLIEELNQLNLGQLFQNQNFHIKVEYKQVTGEMIFPATN